MGYTIEDYNAYIDYCKSIGQAENNEMDIDQIDSNIETLENVRGLIDQKIEELQQQRTYRLKNVKMLRKLPKKQDKIAC
jgi:hypothetical protein